MQKTMKLGFAVAVGALALVAGFAQVNPGGAAGSSYSAAFAAPEQTLSLTSRGYRTAAPRYPDGKAEDAAKES